MKRLLLAAFADSSTEVSSYGVVGSIDRVFVSFAQLGHPQFLDALWGRKNESQFGCGAMCSGMSAPPDSNLQDFRVGMGVRF